MLRLQAGAFQLGREPIRRGSLRSVSTDETFDLSAAALRAEQDELASSVELLASTLEQALPALASVERRKVGRFRSQRRELQRIALALGDEQFELRRSAQGFKGTRNKVVRGITLNRQELALADWIAAVIAAAGRTAEIGERDRVALEGLLR
jgi:hypothetical protein